MPVYAVFQREGLKSARQGAVLAVGIFCRLRRIETEYIGRGPFGKQTVNEATMLFY
jgi:hypothetical protein